MSGSRTITLDDERLDNVHVGDILREDFLIGTEIPVEDVAAGSGIDVDEIIAIMDCRKDVDARIDLRLARYFGMSDGFFLRLQNHWDIEEVLRSEGAELDRIIQRAA
ncbi:addiction module antidote protein, HigA family [Blastomonas sp. RAC04]|uniref:HigA family addiction module antitoxin n=1 Tax=Blastomonas sp. RAC04 TaxID=1842535 RepID=UPI00083D1107|nr:HigA family addiction module antitoxin [Blastomonas sp. RAC04]AOF99003.1 addiction module antidote protein, HigA family [Blastomonas sp. RAC04]